ncbi:hypothetical protein HYFRA_00003347 [Hymenoscyphus fraxineus]|uniref:Uncharacterized protein n=1 Tax=Hymenoscyphus fraxineus TaxID=746836 RepID=A0A9N9KUJ9_9HELO|nr:hypothetical protein HYFRA_00003347 [Hymenoscyphus fraxineus]
MASIPTTIITSASKSYTTSTSISTIQSTVFKNQNHFLHGMPLDQRSFVGGLICAFMLFVPILIFLSPRLRRRNTQSYHRVIARIRQDQDALRRRTEAHIDLYITRNRALNFEKNRLRMVASELELERMGLVQRELGLQNTSLQHLTDRQNIAMEMDRLNAAKMAFASERRAFEEQQLRERQAAQLYRDATMRQIADETDDIRRLRGVAFADTQNEMNVLLAMATAIDVGTRELERRSTAFRRGIQIIESKWDAIEATKADLTRWERRLWKDDVAINGDRYLEESAEARTVLF